MNAKLGKTLVAAILFSCLASCSYGAYLGLNVGNRPTPSDSTSTPTGSSTPSSSVSYSIDESRASSAYLGELYYPKVGEGVHYVPLQNREYRDQTGAPLGQNGFCYSEPVSISGVDFGSVFQFATHYSWEATESRDSRLVFEINPNTWRTLSFAVGMRDSATKANSVKFEVLLDGQKAVDQAVRFYDSVRYFSLDVTNVKEVEFHIAQRWMADGNVCLAGATLFKEPNATIKPTYEKATEQEQLLKKSKVVRQSSCTAVFDQDPSTVRKVDSRTILSGISLTPNPQEFPYETNTPYSGAFVLLNCAGRYKYLHFRLGHLDQSYGANGPIVFFLTVDGVRKAEYHLTDKDLFQEITVDVDYALTVGFEALPEDETETLINPKLRGTYLVFDLYGSPNEAPAFPKMIDATFESCNTLTYFKRPYYVVSQVSDNPVVTSGNRYTGVPVCGVVYAEGMVLQPCLRVTTKRTIEVPAEAYFNLEKRVRYFSFKVGRVDRSAIGESTLRIYGDDELLLTAKLDFVCETKDFVVDTKNCQILRFEVSGGCPDAGREVKYGFVEMAAHTNAYKALTFTKYRHSGWQPMGSEKAHKLMEEIPPYDSFSFADNGDTLADTRKHEGEGFSKTFKAGGATRYNGIILRTGYYVDSTAPLALSLCGDHPFLNGIECGSFIAFDLGEKFTALSFDVASINGAGGNNKKMMRLFGDGQELTSSLIAAGTKGKHFEVDVTGVSSLVFSLDFGEEDELQNTTSFGFYNLVVS